MKTKIRHGKITKDQPQYMECPRCFTICGGGLHTNFTRLCSSHSHNGKCYITGKGRMTKKQFENFIRG